MKKSKKVETSKVDNRDTNLFFFLQEKGHIKKECSKYKDWVEKKGYLVYLVCYESNMVDIFHNIWWIYYGFTVHISNIMEG